MDILALSEQNLDKLIQFEKRARISEPDIFVHEFDEVKFKSDTLNALKNPLFSSAQCLMCVDAGGDVVGRIDFSVLSSFAFGGDMRAYVDWVYVLKECRHRGIAQFLFEKMEEVLTGLGVCEYFLITAENEDAQRFYAGLRNAKIEGQAVLTKRFINRNCSCAIFKHSSVIQ